MTSFMVGVVIAKRKLNSPYIDHIFKAHAVLPEAPQTPFGAELGVNGNDTYYYGGAHELRIFAGETSHYRDNLISGDPSLWVAVTQDGAVTLVTADPYEGEARVTNNIDEQIEKLPMPSDIRDALATFFQEHHVEHTFVKRKRNKFDADKRQFEGKDDA